jgi:hypothetical protein
LQRAFSFCGACSPAVAARQRFGSSVQADEGDVGQR